MAPNVIAILFDAKYCVKLVDNIFGSYIAILQSIGYIFSGFIPMTRNKPSPERGEREPASCAFQQAANAIHRVAAA